MKGKVFLMALIAGMMAVSCNKNEPEPPIDPPVAEEPESEPEIHEYTGERADDAALDVVGTDKDFYWEANNFNTKVHLTYKGSTVEFSCDNEEVEYHAEGAHVVIDMQTHDVSGVEIEVSGKSYDGSLKIYGSSKYKLTLAGVELTSSRGPAINSQCKKRIYVHLAEGTTNRLTDVSKYSDDVWYIDPARSGDEDRKGAFFSEGHLIFSGTGVLVVAGKQKNGIASDGYMFTRPGVTIAVTEAAKNAVHIKGDSDDGIGILVTGGLIYANVASDAGKGIKTDLDAEIRGGKLDLNTSGNAVYEADENETSSASGIKTDGDILISGGTISVKSIGTGGKGLSADGNITITGGETSISTTGKKFRYSSSLTSSPKGVKADGNILIEGGKLNISVTGVSDGSEGLESKSVLTINGGEIYIHAYDDAINAAEALVVNGGRIYAYSVNNDGIDSNGELTFNGGLTIAVGGNAPEESFDCDVSSKFLVNGGTLVGVAGGMMSTPSSASTQRVVLYGGISASQEQKLAILDASGDPLMTYTVPRSMNSLVLFFSSEGLEQGQTYTISKGGDINGYTDTWNGWYQDGIWSNGTTVGSFTSNSVVTVVGRQGGPGGGGGTGGRP